jgi:acyl-CoA reductase-like NAD-dependent aldehyde dehydrogenase
MITAETTYPNLVGGRWISPDDAPLITTNPAQKDEVLGRFPSATPQDVRAALDAAAQALPNWAMHTPTQKAAPLFRAADLIDQRAALLAETITKEEGKTIGESIAEVRRTAACFRFYAGQAHVVSGETLPSDEQHTLLMTVREPAGVAAAITPWNFPLSLAARKLAPALVTGCTVLFKPSSLTPLSALRLTEILVEAGLPAGVLSFLTGSGPTIGKALAEDARLRAVSFTGSTEAGRVLHRLLPLGTRVQMELGGKNALVVLDDADVELAARLAVQGAFGLSGQACTATSRVIVVEEKAEDLTRRIVERANQLKVGNGLRQDVQVGPLASFEQEKTVLDYIRIGIDEGAELLCGGAKLTGGEYDQGYYVQPTVFRCPSADLRIAKEEIFGPVLAIITVKDFDEAVAVTNATTYGLVASICTSSVHKAHAFWVYAQVGVVKVNRSTTSNVVNAPFGGVKDSSADTVREGGTAALDFFSRTKTIYLGH